MNSSDHIYELLWAPNQELSDAAFLPYKRQDNSKAAWREFYVFVEMYRAGLHRNGYRTGLLSPKFNLKTHINGPQLRQFADEHRDADVCIINPFPQLAYFSYNVWMQGEKSHPGLIERAQNLLDESGIDWQIKDTPRHNHANLCYCNFWLGSSAFWEKYVGGVLLPIAEFLEKCPQHKVARSVMENTSHTDETPFLPFIIERLFSTYLSLNPQINVAAYDLGGDNLESYCVTEFEKDIVKYMKPIVDAADNNNQHTPELISLMEMLCGLWQKHFFEYFSAHKHPHTGKTSKFTRQ